MMTCRLWLACLCAGVVSIVAIPAVAEPAKAGRQKPPLTALHEIAPAITACWQAPAGSAGSAITVTFMLHRTGAVLGKPRITWSRLTGDAQAQRDFVASVLAAFARCTPLNVSPSLGRALGNRRFALRFASTARQTPV